VDDDGASQVPDPGDLTSIRAAAERGADLHDLVVPTGQGPRRLLDAVLRQDDPALLAAVLALRA